MHTAPLAVPGGEGSFYSYISRGGGVQGLIGPVMKGVASKLESKIVASDPLARPPGLNNVTSGPLHAPALLL
jgi:hypothetical protein